MFGFWIRWYSGSETRVHVEMGFRHSLNCTQVQSHLVCALQDESVHVVSTTWWMVPDFGCSSPERREEIADIFGEKGKWRWAQVSCCRNNGWKSDQPYQEFVQSNLSLSFRPMWSVSGDAFSLFMKMRNNRFVYCQPHHWRIAMWLMVKGSNGYYCVAQCGWVALC